jgi:hypothetical protein
MTADQATDAQTGIRIRFIRAFDVLPAPNRGYQWTLFGCGRVYQGPPDEIAPAIERHRKSGCKGCRRYQRRIAAIDKRRFEARS